jgi:shikimate kinase
MQLSRAEFERRYAEGNLRIALIGMSNIGKSYTGMRHATAFDFDLIEVDKLIRETLGHDDMDAFAAWQGQPYSDGYEAREAESKALESVATQKALESQTGNAILDTTGSVIYTEKFVQENLASNWYIIHIAASKDAVERLKTQYFKQPKPLMWNGHFSCKPGQDPEAAILESYPKLLASRANDYAALADGTIASNVILDTSLTIQDIFERLKPAV